jgi:hypothetical protein
MICLQVRASLAVLVGLVKLEFRPVIPEQLVGCPTVIGFGIHMAEQPNGFRVNTSVNERALECKWHGDRSSRSKQSDD